MKQEKPSRLTLMQGDQVEVVKSLLVMREPGGALMSSGYLPEGRILTVTKRPKKYEGVNCVEFSLEEGTILYSYWVDFRNNTRVKG